MNKIKILSISLAVIFLALIALVLFKAKNNADLQQSMALAHETKNALNHMMFDLSQGRIAATHHLPLDGQWHERIILIQTQHGTLEYVMRMRRQTAAPGILEVQLEDHKSLALVSNFKIRTRE